jgi:hypothetical protein
MIKHPERKNKRKIISVKERVMSSSILFSEVSFPNQHNSSFIYSEIYAKENFYPKIIT